LKIAGIRKEALKSPCRLSGNLHSREALQRHHGFGNRGLFCFWEAGCPQSTYHGNVFKTELRGVDKLDILC